MTPINSLDLLQAQKRLTEIITTNIREERHNWPDTEIFDEDLYLMLTCTTVLILIMQLSTIATLYTLWVEAFKNKDTFLCKRHPQNKLKDLLKKVNKVNQVGSSGSLSRMLKPMTLKEYMATNQT